MSRTKRYVPHWVRWDALHPSIDPLTLKPYVWGTIERQQYYAQREQSKLKGCDGKNPVFRCCWQNHNDVIRTATRKFINEGIEDHFDALEDAGEIFDWRGYSDCSIEIWREELQAEEDAFWESQSDDWGDLFEPEPEEEPYYPEADPWDGWDDRYYF